ncbi:hypothetical protein ACW0TR_00830, partial [Fusobacterium polymorphum]
YGAAAMIHFLDTEEGKAIAKKNLGTVGIKGIAITALGYGKLDRRIKTLGTKAQLYYMRNIGDWVSFIAAQGMKRKGKEEQITVPNYEYKIGEMDGRDMRSIRER